jgi:hypothetical protein
VLEWKILEDEYGSHCFEYKIPKEDENVCGSEDIVPYFDGMNGSM